MGGPTLPFPLAGRTLIVGPSNAGKTTMTARAVAAWIDEYGPGGVVVFEFGPEVDHDGRVLGRRLSRFTALPDRAWQGVLDAYAPRAEGRSPGETVDLARDNARRAATLFAAAPPDPRAVFVNDGTIPFQHADGDPEVLFAYCERAECTVVNAFESEELGSTDPVSREERATLEAFKAWADRVVRLDGPDGTDNP